MTSQFTSEENLFDNNSEEETVLNRTPSRKRHSFGPRLPISVRSPSRSPPNMSQEGQSQPGNPEQGKGKGKHTRGSPSQAGSATALGFPNMNFDPENPQIMIGQGKEGQQVRTDVFNDIFVGGMPAGQLEKLLNYLHTSGKLEFSGFINDILYQGFDRLYYIRIALGKVSVGTFCKFAILGAVRGSNFKKIVDSCLSMPPELTRAVDTGLVIKTAKKRDDLTILRFTAAIPHWVAFWLYGVSMSKKIETEDCPGWLQFPGAASLPMSKTVRLQHISFCKAFSAILPGGSFNPNIYLTAYNNPIPLKDIPSMIKPGLGIGENNQITGDISQEEVRQNVGLALVKA